MGMHTCAMGNAHFPAIFLFFELLRCHRIKYFFQKKNGEKPQKYRCCLNYGNSALSVVISRNYSKWRITRWADPKLTRKQAKSKKMVFKNQDTRNMVSNTPPRDTCVLQVDKMRNQKMA